MEYNQVYNMDCIEGMQLIPDASIDCVITDPPYGTTACKRDTIIPFDLMREQLKRVIKPNGAIVLFGSQPFTSSLVVSNPDMFKYERIWDKVSGKDFYQARRRPLKQHENILVFSDGNTIYNPQTYEAEKKNMRDRVKNKTKEQQGTIYGHIKEYVSQKDERQRYPGSVFVHSYQENELHYSKRLHPTQKPVALIEYLVKTYTNKGEVVLDFAMGSGTTGVACMNTDRNFIGFELDEGYCDVANKRIYDNIKQHYECPMCGVDIEEHQRACMNCTAGNF